MGSKIGKIAFVGNGFDLYHAIPATFKGYYHSEYMRSTTKASYEYLLEKYEIAADGNSWYDFECVYCNLVKKESKAMQNGYGGSPLGLSMGSAPRYSQAIWEINKVFKTITKEFKQYLKEKYGQCMEQGQCIKNKAAEQVLHGVDMIITFNYTATLERVYGIPTDKIIYVHGALKDNNIILGYNSYYDESVEDYALCGLMDPDALLGDKAFSRILQNGGNEWLKPGNYKPVMDAAHSAPYAIFKDLAGNLIQPENPLALDFAAEVEVCVLGHGMQSDRDLLSTIPQKIKKANVFGIPGKQAETSKLQQRATELFHTDKVEALSY